jgi:hypothetical protein
MCLPFLLEEICGPILGIYKSLTDTWHMHVEIGAEAAQVPEKEYINGIAVAVSYKYYRKPGCLGMRVNLTCVTVMVTSWGSVSLRLCSPQVTWEFGVSTVKDIPFDFEILANKYYRDSTFFGTLTLVTLYINFYS